MQTFFMFGRYTSDSLRGVSSQRTQDAKRVVVQCKGKVHSMYALLGQHDLVFVASFPGTEQAMKASIGLSRLTGIQFSTSPAVAVESFDRLVS